MNSIKLWVVFPALAIFLVVSAPAHAYLDPASGSMIFQVILAGIAGALVFLGRIRAFVRGLFEAKRSKESSAE